MKKGVTEVERNISAAEFVGELPPTTSSHTKNSVRAVEFRSIY